MTQPSVQIAVDLLPLIQRVYSEGVLCIGPGNEVHLRPHLFRATFPEVTKAVPRDSEEYPWKFEAVVTIDGREITFFSLSESEEWPE